jgi:hypothetical protein
MMSSAWCVRAILSLNDTFDLEDELVMHIQSNPIPSGEQGDGY